jgi:hypothetical protein
VNKTEQADQFQVWLIHMDDALEEFIQTLPNPLQKKLNNTIESLDALEGWLLERYPSIEHAKPMSESLTIDGAARYVGEVFRVASGSKWAIQLDDPKQLFYGRPVLLGGKLGSIPSSPLSMVTASLDRRTGKYLSGIVKNFAN